MITFKDKKEISRIIERLQEISRVDASKTIPVPAREPLGRLVAAVNALIRMRSTRIEQLEKENSRMETMLNSMAEGVIAVDKDTRIMLINPSIEQLFAVKDEEAEGKFFLEVFRNNAIAELIQSVLGNAEHLSSEITLTWPVQRVFEVSVSPILTQAGVSGCLLVIYDVTEIRKLERMRSDFVANVSHELKTPLTSIKGFVETLLAGAWKDKKNSVEFLKIIQTHTERLNNLINDLLSLSHIESKKITLELVDIDLRALLESVVKVFQARMHKRGVQVDVRLKKSHVVRADKDQLEEVFINLIDNAIKFNRDKGRISISAHQDDEKIKLVVEDTGVGIPENDIERIFERFYRVDKARSRELGGTGLGLSIVKHIVELHGGCVGVESTEGVGSRFWFTLPR